MQLHSDSILDYFFQDRCRCGDVIGCGCCGCCCPHRCNIHEWPRGYVCALRLTRCVFFTSDPCCSRPKLHSTSCCHRSGLFDAWSSRGYEGIVSDFELVREVVSATGWCGGHELVVGGRRGALRGSLTTPCGLSPVRLGRACSSSTVC